MKILLDPNPTDGGFTPPKTTTPKQLVPLQTKEPPKEILSQTFRVDPAIEAADGSEGTVTAEDKLGKSTPLSLTTDTTVEEPKLTDKKPEEKKEEKKEEPKVSSVLKPPSKEKKEVGKEEVVKQITPPSKDKTPRDYSGFSSEETAMLKQMSNESFDFTSKLIKKLKDVEKYKDDTFLQHPDAYTLTPQFKTLQTRSNFARREADYWESCLELLDQGKSIKSLEGWKEDGTPVFGQEFEASKKVEERVRANMNECYGVVRQTQNELQQYPNQFKERTKQDLDAINNERAKRFAWVSNPALLDYTVEIEGVGDKSLRDIKKDFIDLFPPYYRNNPAAETAADLFIALRLQYAELQEAKNSQNVASTKLEEVKRAEPSSVVKPAPQGEAINGVREFSMKDFPE